MKELLVITLVVITIEHIALSTVFYFIGNGICKDAEHKSLKNFNIADGQPKPYDENELNKQTEFGSSLLKVSQILHMTFCILMLTIGFYILQTIGRI